MNNKEQILDLYYNHHLKQVEITKTLGIIQQYVSKIIKQDDKYESERNARKELNAKKRKISQAEYQKKYVRKSKINM